jgi:hypothetical protein
VSLVAQYHATSAWQKNESNVGLFPEDGMKYPLVAEVGVEGSEEV